MATIRSLPVELLLQIFEILVDHWIDEPRLYAGDEDTPSIWVTTLSNAHIQPCSLVCKQWSTHSLPFVDKLLRLSVTNMEGILLFMRQSRTRCSHVRHLFVNYPGESRELAREANWMGLWDVLGEVLNSLVGQLETMDILLWEMKGPRKCPSAEARLRLPPNLRILWIRSSVGMTNPVLQDWFTGLEDCKALKHLELRDVHASQSSPAAFALNDLVISAIRPSETAFFSASARTLTSLTAFRSVRFDTERYPRFWPAFFPLLHFVKDTLRELDMNGYCRGIVVRYDEEHQLVAPILPLLETLKLSTDFLGNLVDSFPHLRLSSRLVRLKLKDVPIMSDEDDARAQEFLCNFQHLQRLSICFDSEDLSIKFIKPVFDPVLHPHKLMRLDTNLTTFVSVAELKSFLQISQPQMLDIFLESSFEALHFLLTSGHTIPGIQDMRLSGDFSRSRSEGSDFDSLPFTKGSCAAKRLDFRLHLAPSWSGPFCFFDYGSNGGFAPLITFLSGSAWTDQLERLKFQRMYRSGRVPRLNLNQKQWSAYENLRERLGTRFVVEELEFFSYQIERRIKYDE
ncbi:hypothetical protein BT69DRAFT_774168 [Atractiella rhizophila]|nr:hypothetical protein BT69DRAFT_774168 [Atractiella rhizophila]